MNVIRNTWGNFFKETLNLFSQRILYQTVKSAPAAKIRIPPIIYELTYFSYIKKSRVKRKQFADLF